MIVSNVSNITLYLQQSILECQVLFGVFLQSVNISHFKMILISRAIYIVLKKLKIKLWESVHKFTTFGQ